MQWTADFDPPPLSLSGGATPRAHSFAICYGPQRFARQQQFDSAQQ
jgi:hypothetical protein